MRFLIVALLLAACSGPTDPDDARGPFGRLAGVVTIGPFCPVTTPQPCPTPPSAYTARKILVYDEAGSRLLHTVDIDTRGLYVIDLPPARYTVDIRKVGMDSSKDVPAVVTIRANLVTSLDIAIDTGIR